MDNLPELRDIHLPEGVSAFPPAYGWWIILLGFLLMFGLYRLWKLWRQKSKKLYALRLLDSIKAANIVEEAREMSEILRRICIFKYPEAAALFGRPWIDFLNSHSREKLEGKAAELLIDAPYIHPATKTFVQTDADKLREYCQSWIGENL